MFSQWQMLKKSDDFSSPAGPNFEEEEKKSSIDLGFAASGSFSFARNKKKNVFNVYV